MNYAIFAVVFVTICGLVFAELPYQEFLNRRVRNPAKLREKRTIWRGSHGFHGSRGSHGSYGSHGSHGSYGSHQHSRWGHSHGPSEWRFSNRPSFGGHQESHGHYHGHHGYHQYPHFEHNHQFPNFRPDGGPSTLKPSTEAPNSNPLTQSPSPPHFGSNPQIPNITEYPYETTQQVTIDQNPGDTSKDKNKTNGTDGIGEHKPTESSNLTTPSPETSTTKSSTVSPMSVEECVKACPETKGYNPICGTNNVTYQNIEMFLCAKKCGLAIEVRGESECPTKETTNSNNSTTPNPETSTTKSSTVSPMSVEECVKACPETKGYNPICGTNNVTYQNIEMFLCAKKCGLAIEVRGESECPTKETTNSNNLTTPNPETSTSKSSTVSPMSVEECVKSCPETKGYNPICGTNNVTYQNIEMFLCAKKCGLAIEVRGESECPTKETTISTTEESLPETTKKSSIKKTLAFQLCMNSCVYSPDFKPVCGTDLDTYYNHDRLQCAKKCGEDVELLCEFACYTSHCSEHFITTSSTTPTTLTTITTHTAKTILPKITTPTTKTTPTETATAAALTTSTTSIGPCPSCLNIEETTQKTNLQHCLQNICPVTSEYNPVCGTNGVTYDNPGKLLCAQQCGVDVELKHSSRCSVIEAGKANLTALPTTESPESITVTCLKACPVTSEYNPVCGTNNVTYPNLAKLECLRMCGAVDVELSYHSACSGDQKGLDKTSTSTTATSSIAAASSTTSRHDTTSTTTSRITVITTTTSNLSTDNIPDTTENSSTTDNVNQIDTETKTQTTPNGFIIDQNALDFIFGKNRTTTEGTPTTTEEDFFIDPRFNSV